MNEIINVEWQHLKQFSCNQTINSNTWNHLTLESVDQLFIAITPNSTLYWSTL